MSRVILTIDCDFVFDKLLDIVNGFVLSEGVTMDGFFKFLIENNKYNYYEKILKPNSEKVLFINNIIKKHLQNSKKNILVIKEHHEILKHICEDDIIFNIDYHEDIDYDSPEIFCGNWANNIKNYVWTSDIDENFYDMDYDQIIVCYSPEWTPNVKWIDNSLVRKKLEDLQEI